MMWLKSTSAKRGPCKGSACVQNLRPSQLQSGFGLIELMVAMAIASFLVLGLVAMAGSMQSAYTTETNLAAVHDKERFASALFGALLQSGGYYTVSYSSSNTTVPQPSSLLTPVTANNAPGAVYTSGQSIAGSGAAGGAGPDVLNVRYADNGADTQGYNCLGSSLGGAGTYESVLSIDTHNNLVCQVGLNGAAPAASIGGASGSSVILIDGVTNMQIFYGVLDNAPNLRYYRSIDMTSLLWTSVRSVKVQLTFTDPTTALNSNPTTYNFVQTYQVMYGAP